VLADKTEAALGNELFAGYAVPKTFWEGFQSLPYI
jgi:hypothetical protein